MGCSGTKNLAGFLVLSARHEMATPLKIMLRPGGVAL
jgi:hypothetical protein